MSNAIRSREGSGLLVGSKGVLLLLGEEGLLLRVLLCLLLRLQVRRHWDGCQRWTRSPWPHLNGSGPGVVDAGPWPPAGRLLLLLLCATSGA